jgi:integrase
MNKTSRLLETPPVTRLPRASKTFAEAAASYVEHGGEAKYLDAVLPHIGSAAVTSIYPFDVRELAKLLLPTQRNSTRNRCVITPIRAVLNHAYDRGWGDMLRVRNMKEDRPRRKNAASQAWVHAFVRQCSRDGLDHLANLVLFMSQTGARVSEAIALRWEHVDLAARTALLVKTKTDQNSMRHMTDQLVARLYSASTAASPGARVFLYSNRHSVNERIAAVCSRAGISYKPSHTCGRHAFANNTLAMGVDIKSAMDAGGWRSINVFLGTYANPRNSGRIVADRHNLYHFDNDL